MKKQVNFPLVALISVSLVVVIMLVLSILSNAGGAGKSLNSAGKSASVPTAGSNDALYKPVKERRPASDKRKGRDLVEASSEDIAGYAKLFASQQLKAKGDQEVRLVRNVTREQVAELGFGCLPDFSSIEQPPLILVILKGEYDFSSAMPGGGPGRSEPLLPPGHKSYVAYVFDAWAAFPVLMGSTIDGSNVKKALNDPTLPDPPYVSSSPFVCPTQVPASQKKYHYGEEVPGYTDVPPLPRDIQEHAVPTEPIAPPTPTEVGAPDVPLPIPTANDLPVLPTAPPD